MNPTRTQTFGQVQLSGFIAEFLANRAEGLELPPATIAWWDEDICILPAPMPHSPSRRLREVIGAVFVREIGMWINAKTLKELTPAEAAFLGIPLYGQAVYGKAVFMSKVEAQRRLDAALQLQGGKMQKVTVALNLAGLSQTQLIQKLQTVVDLNTPAPVAGNAAAVAPDPSVVTLAATLDLIHAKQTLIADNTEVLKGHHADLVSLLATGSQQLAPVGQMIENNCGNSAAYCTAHGVDVVQPASHVTSLPQILNLTAEHGDAEHSVHLNWKTTRIKDVLHVIEMSNDPTGQTGYHQVDVCKPSHYDALNLAPSTDWFRVAARKGQVQGPWSAPVRFVIN